MNSGTIFRCKQVITSREKEIFRCKQVITSREKDINPHLSFVNYKYSVTINLSYHYLLLLPLNFSMN
jgi:hypothetical protein